METTYKTRQGEPVVTHDTSLADTDIVCHVVVSMHLEPNSDLIPQKVDLGLISEGQPHTSAIQSLQLRALAVSDLH